MQYASVRKILSFMRFHSFVECLNLTDSHDEKSVLGDICISLGNATLMMEGLDMDVGRNT
jgi:hypothetical protein